MRNAHADFRSQSADTVVLPGNLKHQKRRKLFQKLADLKIGISRLQDPQLK
jgi:hypothetical protein